MPIYTTDAPGFTPDDYGTLIVRPVTAASVALTTTTVVTTASTVFHVPVVTDDPSAGWVAEGGEITPDDATLDEVQVTPSKVAGLTIISRELATDSSPAAAQVVGDGLARDIARQVDTAFYGTTTTNGPGGLGGVTGVSTVDTGGTWSNLDWAAEAISKAEQEGAELSAFVGHPTDVLTLSKLKDETGSNRPLLGTDPTAPTRRTILGVPLHVSAAVTAGTIWAYDRTRIVTVMRDDVTLDVDRSAYFTSDRIAIRATMRIGFGYPHPASIVKIYDVP